MKIVSIAKVVKLAEKLNKDGKKWHFHLLTPKCVFNKEKNFALVLENTSDGEIFVNYSEVKQEEAGKVMLELLHGIKADEFETRTASSASLEIQNMAKRAKELTEKGIPWHHHALFPDCVFNKAKGRWVVMLEDPETKEVLENVTDYKPDADLQLIEPLFYKQKE